MQSILNIIVGLIHVGGHLARSCIQHREAGGLLLYMALPSCHGDSTINNNIFIIITNQMLSFSNRLSWE